MRTIYKIDNIHLKLRVFHQAHSALAPSPTNWRFHIRTLFSSSFYKALGSLGGEGDGTPLQYSCVENPMDRGAWKAAVHGVAEGWTRLSDFTFTFHFHALEKEMATHSSVLAWRIPGMGSLVGCRLWGRTESDMTEVTQQQQQCVYVSPNLLIYPPPFIFR